MSDHMMGLWEGLRYRLYSVDSDGIMRGIAEAGTPEAIGLALITIAEENRLAGAPCETVGVLDWHNHRWLSNPGWLTRNLTPFH